MSYRNLLLLGGFTVKAFTDTGSGSDAILPTTFTIADSGAGVDAWTLSSVSAAMSDAGVGSETISTIIGEYVALYDDAYSSDSASIAFGGISISDSGVGTEADVMQISVALLDTGAGTETFGLTYAFTLIDPALSAELAAVAPVSGNFVVSDFSIGVDFTFRLQGYLQLGGFDLPHVQTLKISEQPDIEDLKIQGGSLPKRSIISKMGRVVDIEGWTYNQSDIAALEVMKDGTIRLFLHPSGDSFAVLVSDFSADNVADDYGRLTYRITLKETRTW
jgi:hypothetical protein